MRRTMTLVAAFLALTAFSDVTSFCWLGTNEIDCAGTYVSPYQASVGAYPMSSSATFTVTVPRGYKVSYWAWAEDQNGLMNGVSLGIDKNCWIGQTVTDATTFTWDKDVQGTANKALGVRLDPIPYNIAFEKGSGDVSGMMPPMAVESYITPTNLTPNAFVRPGYSFTGWATNTATMVRAFSDKQSVTGYDFDSVVHSNDTVTLTACWTANVYTVSFDANGGTVSPTQKQVAFNAAYGDLPTPDLAGHEFGGWYTAKTGGSQITATSTMSSPGDQTLFAQWGTKSYTISGRTTGTGSGSVQGVGTFKYGTEIELRAEANTGSEFKGWTDGESANPRTVTVTSNATYTAIFEKKVYKVTFNFKTATGGSTNVVRMVNHGERAEPPNADIRKGYRFQRWDPENYASVMSEHTEVAVYEENHYTVRYDGNGGTCTIEDMPLSYSQQQALRKAVATKVYRSGYVFSGWSESAGATVPDYEDGETVSGLTSVDGGVVTLYAVWDPISYSIAFDAAGGEGTMDPMTNILYDVVTNLTPNAFTKTGCEFLCWERKETGEAYETYQDGAAVSNLTTNANVTVTLTAVWDAPYWVKFEPNGGKGTMEIQRFERNEPQNLASNEFSRTGYSFAGWATNGETTVVFTNGAALKDAFPVGTTNALSAVWSANTYTVTYAPGATDATGTMEPQKFYYDEAQLLKSCSYQRDLWRFIGWSNTVSHVFFSTNDLTNAVSNLTAEARGIVPMVAIWESALSDLSRALDCDNLNWENFDNTGAYWGPWEVTTAMAHQGESCVVQNCEGGDSLVVLSAVIRTNGTLKLWWKPTHEAAKLLVQLVQDGGDPLILKEKDERPGTVGEWNELPLTIPSLTYPSATIEIRHENAQGDGYLYIDDVTWTPEGGTNPEPGEKDRREVTSLSVTAKAGSPTEKVLSLSFSGDVNFDYRLLSSDTLLPPNWQPIGDPISGETGKSALGEGAKSALEGGAKSALGEGVERILTFTVPMDPAKPQRFFKIETLQKK